MVPYSPLRLTYRYRTEYVWLQRKWCGVEGAEEEGEGVTGFVRAWKGTESERKRDKSESGQGSIIREKDKGTLRFDDSERKYLFFSLSAEMY